MHEEMMKRKAMTKASDHKDGPDGNIVCYHE